MFPPAPARDALAGDLFDPCRARRRSPGRPTKTVPVAVGAHKALPCSAFRRKTAI